MVNSTIDASIKQLTILSYACVCIRFIKDGSLVLALLAWATVNLSVFMGSVLSAYQESVNSGSEDAERAGSPPVVRALMHKGLKYTQVILLLQVVYGILYHMRMDFGSNGCNRNHKYMILLLVGEEECGRGGRWLLLALDWAILFMQLILIAMELTPKDGGNCDELYQLDTERYGVLAILRFDPQDSMPSSSFQELPVTRGHRYGST